MIKVLDANGREIDMEAAAMLMDDDIREELHSEGFDSDQEFIEEYAKRHEEKFGESFAPYVGGAW